MRYGPGESNTVASLVPQGLLLIVIAKGNQRLIPHALDQCFHDQVSCPGLL